MVSGSGSVVSVGVGFENSFVIKLGIGIENNAFWFLNIKLIDAIYNGIADNTITQNVNPPNPCRRARDTRTQWAVVNMSKSNKNSKIPHNVNV